MKTENIPADIKSKSLKEARNEINEILIKLESKNLDFVAFNAIHPNITKLFKTHFPNENDRLRLESWDKFEKIYPKTFLGMYKFWVKKKLGLK